jgi:hypothetical protein
MLSSSSPLPRGQRQTADPKQPWIFTDLNNIQYQKTWNFIKAVTMTSNLAIWIPLLKQVFVINCTVGFSNGVMRNLLVPSLEKKGSTWIFHWFTENDYLYIQTLFKTIFIFNSVSFIYSYVQFKVQLDVLFYVFLFILSSTCFGCYLHPSSGAQLQHRAIVVCAVLARLISDWNWPC